MVAAVVLLGLVLIWSLLSWEPSVDRPEQVETPQPPATEPTLAAADKPEPAAPAAEAAPAKAPVPTAPPPAAEPTKPGDKPADPETAPWPVPQMGRPVADFTSQFESEPTDSKAVAAESAIQTGFAGPSVHPALLDSVLCHTLVCRIRMRWTQERAVGFMGGLMHVVTDPLDNVQFDGQVAIDQPLEPNAAGERMVDAYVRLKAPVSH